METKLFTKRAMTRTAVRIKLADLELLRVAAGREEISQSEFLRQAVREKAQRVLLKTEGASDAA